MLKKLTINNIALIDSVEIEFTEGLNVLSGETGSGKSVLIEALNFVLGAKADRDFIRSGETECLVAAEFELQNNPAILAVFEEFDFEPEDVLIITRKLNVEGRGSIKVNGNSVTVAMLKKFTSALVDVFGQSKHFWLLSVTNQLALIDNFGGQSISTVKDVLKNLYTEYVSVKRQLDEIGGDESRRLMRLDVLNYQISEIEKYDLKDGEEEELLSLRLKIINREKIFTAMNAVKSSISTEGGVADLLSNAARAYSPVSGMSKEMTELFDRLQSLIVEADDIADVCDNVLSSYDYFDFDPDYVETRLENIKKLKKKYGSNYAEICAFLENAIIERDKLENFNTLAAELLERKNVLELEIYKKYCILSSERRKAASIFTEKVLVELKELGMEKAQFEAHFSDFASMDDCKFNSVNGFDDMEFLFSANSGEPLKSLSNIISGGEMSRFMLAIKAQTAKYNDISTFIFDEIDAGISGVIAKVVAEKFAKIARQVQVIAVSHLAQVSAMADSNYLISKSDLTGKTLTSVKKLTSDEKVLEVIRLVGGSVESKYAREHSLELIKNAEDYKRNI